MLRYTCIPTHYGLTYTIDMEHSVFHAEEAFSYTVKEKTEEIMLDMIGLTVTSCHMDGKKLNFVCDENSIKIIFDQALERGDYTVIIEFEGAYRDDHAGWYRATYTDQGKKKYMLTSHFEAADARRAFPCIDHPAFKATFSVSFIIERHLDGISNMPMIHEEQLPHGMKKVTCAPTPRMSTYLLYLGVGEFEYREDRYRDILIRGVTTKGKSEYTQFAIDTTKKALAFFEEYFGILYPLPKLDLIADPEFAMGAMENWGAIIFRETRILTYPGKTSLQARQGCAETVVHELAHQWFGNLVTMKWWDDLWLNESFATWMAYKALDALYPEWNMWTEYVEHTVFSGMDMDVLHSSHPVVQPLEDVSEVESRFDEITYDKGGSVLRMLEKYVGKDTFRAGLHAYISQFAYANAEGKDLWQAIENVSGQPVSLVMESFLLHTGFPRIEFHRHKDTIVISQSSFSLDPHTKDKTLWSVPVVLRDIYGKEYRVLLSEKEARVTIPQMTLASTNSDYTQFYVSSSDQTLLDELEKNKAHMTECEKLGLIHDRDFLSRACMITAEQYVQTLHAFFQSETHPAIIGYLLARLETMMRLLPTLPVGELSFTLARRFLDLYGYVPHEGESSHIPSARVMALYTLGLRDDEAVAAFVKGAFEKFLDDENSLHADLRSVVYALAAWQHAENHKKILERYKKQTIEEEKTKLLAALGYSKDQQSYMEVLSLSLTPEVRFINIIYLNSAFIRNMHMRSHAFQWLDTNWSTLMQLSGGGMGEMLLRHILKAIVPLYGLTDEKSVSAFLEKVSSPTLQQGKKEIQEEMEVMRRFIRFNSPQQTS